ncbi:MAG: ATP-binding cassette domain-containing protein [Proteobacteria bacterium]|nr:ATP-binding cassette domain-containing protein [Pseudomonadota bacterium]
MNAGTDNAVALEVVDLAFSYGAKPALEDVSFAVSPGEFKVLLGPNGAGKTTLFSLITRLYDSRQGRITVEGWDLRGHTRRALANMGVVFQLPTLDLDLSVRQNLLYHAALHGMDRARALERIEVELGRLGMAERKHEKTRRLNGGHRRRVEIARALLHEPHLLLLDEPTVGLDVPTRRDIVEHVHRLARDDGIAVLWATHLIDEISDDDSVIVLHEGRIRADGGVAEVSAAAGASDVGGAFDRLTGGPS